MLSKGGDYNLSMEPQTIRLKEGRKQEVVIYAPKLETVPNNYPVDEDENIFTHQAIVLLVPDGSRCGVSSSKGDRITVLPVLGF